MLKALSLKKQSRIFQSPRQSLKYAHCLLKYSTSEAKEQQYIQYIEICNPKQRNALSMEVIEDLKKQFNAVTGEKKVIILKSQGPVFSSGHNLKELSQNLDHKESLNIFQCASELMLTIQQSPQVVIAQVQGLATAAGCQLVATCDLAICSEKASFATPGVKVGLFCTTPGLAISRTIPQKKALEMLFTGDPITASEALQCGLVNKVVAHEELENETLKMASKIASLSGDVLKLGKKAFFRQIRYSNISDAYDFASHTMADNMQLEDTKEGINAFIEKRDPKWR